MRVSRKQQLTTLCSGHYPGACCWQGLRNPESQGILAHRKKEWSPRAHSWAESLFPESERERGRSTKQNKGCAAGTASPGCSAPTVSTALEMSVWILKGDGGYSHRRKTGALHIRGMEDIQTGGWFKHTECLSASTC